MPLLFARISIFTQHSIRLSFMHPTVNSTMQFLDKTLVFTVPAAVHFEGWLAFWVTTSSLVYVIAWGRGQLRINFTSIFKVFTKLPESRSDEGDLENFENTSEINP